MPEPNHRPPWQMEETLGARSIRELVDGQATLTIDCDACCHRARWDPEELARRFGRKPSRSVAALARRLRCSKCRSEWIRLFTSDPVASGPKPTP